MKKKNIIKESREFTEIINNKKRKTNQYYSIYYRPNNTQNRYGISIPKKTGVAVIRNKIKRQIKNIIDTNEKNIQKNFDYVIIVRKDILDLDYQTMNQKFIELINKIGD